jgi:hypothetical protein
MCRVLWRFRDTNQSADVFVTTQVNGETGRPHGSRYLPYLPFKERVDQNNHLPIHKLLLVIPVEEQDMVEEVNLKRGQGRNSCLRKKPYNLEGGWFSKQKSLEGEWFL